MLLKIEHYFHKNPYQLYLFLGFFLACFSEFSFKTAYAVENDIFNMDIESLMTMEVTSVAKKNQKFLDSAAAIYVITAEDIRRSGVNNIAEALRMAPGIHVARIDSSKWAISSRGFNSRFADKLLVLMDGRSLYTPFYSGVYWEVQDTMIEDIDRIEVIRGPGASLWGANAVNGVINIITKHARDTLGGVMTAGLGTYEKAFGRARYGAKMGDGVFGRIYVKGDAKDELTLAHNGEDANDDWETLRSGFRLDGTLNSQTTFILQGDIYKGEIDQQIILPDVSTPPYSFTVADKGEVSGGNIQFSWDKIFSSVSNLTLKAYYDRSEREEIFEHEETDMFDFELKHQLSFAKRHDIVWGAEYRYLNDKYHENDYLFVEAGSVYSQLFSCFIQDEISFFQDRLFLTL